MVEQETRQTEQDLQDEMKGKIKELKVISLITPTKRRCN